MAITKIERLIELDVYNHDTTPTTIKAIACDNDTRYVAAEIQNEGVWYDIGSTASVQLTIIRPDKVGVAVTGQPYPIEYTHGDGQIDSETGEEGEVTDTYYGVYAELDQPALALSGTLLGQFKITNGDQILRTEIFKIDNGRALDAETSDWAGEYEGHNLDEMAAEIEDNTADIASIESDVSQIKEDFTDIINAAYVTDSASGGVAHFVDGADDVPMKSLKVNIAPIQSGSGDPSPDNVRPISGFNSVKVTRTGKNLLPNTAPDTITKSGVTATKNSDGSITLNGTATANVNFEACGFNNRLIPFTCKGQLTLTGCPAGGGTATYRLVAYLYKDGAYTGTFLNDTGGGSTVDADADHIYSIISVYNGQTYNNLTFYPMIRLASDTDDTYEPYNGNTYDISLSSAGTVYGGTLDVVSGELTVDKAIVDLGTLNWTYESTLPRFYTNGLANDIRLLAGNDDVVDGVSSMYKVVSFNNLYVTGKQNGTMAESMTKVVSVINTDYTDATSFKTAMSGQMFVYPLATPLTYQLSATEIKSLLGINNIWSDAGDVDAEYRADTKLYIKRLTDSDTATHKEDFDAIFTETPTGNLFNKNDAITGSYINPYTGEVVEYSGVFHEFIEFEAGTYTFLAQHGIFGGNAYSVAMFDENHNFVSYAEGTHTEIDTMNSIINVTFSSQAASTAKYFSINGTTDILNTLMVVKGTQYPTEYIPYGTYKTIDGLQISKSQIIDLDDEANPLRGKIISLNGDSIAAGAGYQGGYGKIIAEENGMTYENVAVGGGCVAYVGSNVHCISRTISNMRADADYVILDGGGNDADSGVPLGALTTGYTATLDDTTFAGAFEQMLKTAIARFPNKKIGYVFIHKCAYLFSSSVRDSYYDIAKAACEKWGIPYCDLNTQTPPLNYIDALKTAYTSNGDGYHPNEQGYKLFYVPKITAWMKTL